MEVPRRLNIKRLFDAQCVPMSENPQLDNRIYGGILPHRSKDLSMKHGYTLRPLYGPCFCEEFSTPTKEAIREVFPEVRCRRFDLATHNLNKQSLIKLPRKDLPRDKISGDYLYPTSPTFLERLEMIRSGATPGSITRLYGRTVRVSQKEFNDNSRLAVRIVNRNVFGLRSDIEVPRKYFGYFRYCNGFLMLTAPRAMPIGLARFLAGIWCTDPHSLWLERPETLRQCLRRVPYGVYHSVGATESVFSFESDSEEE